MTESGLGRALGAGLGLWLGVLLPTLAVSSAPHPEPSAEGSTTASKILATIAQRWNLHDLGSSPPAIEPRITLRPAGSVSIRIDRR